MATVMTQKNEAPPQPDLAALLDLSHDTIFIRDGATGAISYWNAGAARVYGWEAADLAAPGGYGRLQSRCDVPEETVLEELARTGHWQGGITRTARDGSEIIVSARWAARLRPDGSIGEIVETARDVTVKAVAAEELRRSEYRYQNMFRAMAVSFWELDFSGVKGLLREWRDMGVEDFSAFFAADPDAVRRVMGATRIVDVNEKTLLLFGAADRAELGDTVERFWPRDSEAVFAASVVAAISGKSNFEAETKMLTVDGREVEILFTCSFPPECMGRGNVLVGVLDISGRVRAQEEVQRVQAELAHAARVATLGELAASIAHEVNQPLAAIVNFGEAAKRWLNRPEPDMAEAAAAIERMIGDSRRASDIIGRIRAMATKSVPKPTLFHPCEAVKEAVQLVRHDMQARGVALSIAEVEAVPRVRADRIQIQQVAVNLIVNAVQAMAQVPEDRRALVIRTGLAGDNMVRIEVQDSGPGIDPVVADRLFTAFASTKDSGMGMGLSISRSIVEAHGGTICGRGNEAAPGATFSFTLPVAEMTADDAAGACTAAA
ncbi:PAS/PAC sensor signal transduction histidine kinase [Sphingomonas sp. MM-1]|uniref:PAS domain-containing sensor histidine kinase n=1 Tax=Sphingomonas sp. MM-1 TaxID=745310 RepID=UPI0002C097B8|nr:ATP-binding protein [Sphingomonas sp. MM-1]AGH48464.1 PAS/PAC sensor signal transduction histidine kinase [Sphingomonas sp. MM-1]